MSFLGGTFFDPDRLPLALKPIVYGLPLTHASLGMRSIVRGDSPPWYSGIIIFALAVGLGFLGAYQFSRQQD